MVYPLETQAGRRRRAAHPGPPAAGTAAALRRSRWGALGGNRSRRRAVRQASRRADRSPPRAGRRSGLAPRSARRREVFELDDACLVDLVDGGAVGPASAATRARPGPMRGSPPGGFRLSPPRCQSCRRSGCARRSTSAIRCIPSWPPSSTSTGVQYSHDWPSGRTSCILHRAHQRLGEGIVDQRVVCPVRQGASDCDAGRGNARHRLARSEVSLAVRAMPPLPK